MALTPGQRVDIKKAIAGTLGRQEWADIDLTLSEFGFRTEDEWRDDDRTNYVLEMLGGSTADDALSDLHAYLHPTAGPTAPPQPETRDAFDDPNSPWVGQGFRLFLSHIHQAKVQAGALRAELAKRSVDAFVAHDSIDPTEDWQDVIVSALRSCDGCLALLTPGFPESKWTDQEIGFCMARNLLVIPLEWGLNPYGFLGRYQALPVRQGQHQADVALAVFELLIRKPQSRDAMARALVARWARSGSFDAARQNYSFLAAIPRDVWNQSLVNEVWRARERNSELREASINWRPSDRALEHLFAGLPFTRPT